MKRSAFLKITMALMMGISLVVSPMAEARSLTVSAAMARHYWAWQVTIQGTVYGRPFARQGVLYLTDPFPSAGTINGANPIEVALISGSPITSPQIGAIQYTTNSGVFGQRAQLDLAYVSFDSNAGRVTVQPDNRLGANAGTNVFNALSGITANVYQIYAGQMQLQFRNNYNSVTGTINFLGNPFIEPAAAPYVATISGQFVGSGTF